MAASEEMVTVCFGIVAAVGAAKSCYINAITMAKNGDYEGAEEAIEEGNRDFAEGHKNHMRILQRDASGDTPEFSLILMHAEDQMMSAETFRVIAEDFIDVYRKLNAR